MSNYAGDVDGRPERLEDREINRLAVELNAAIYNKCRELVRRELGASAVSVKRDHSTRLRILKAAGVDLERAVLEARADGLTWGEIGTACAMTRQAANERWGGVARKDEEYRREASGPIDPVEWALNRDRKSKGS